MNEHDRSYDHVFSHVEYLALENILCQSSNVFE